jgi:hypothetical protein
VTAPARDPMDNVNDAADAVTKAAGSIGDDGTTVREAAGDVGDAAGAVMKAADSVGDAVPVVSGVTDRVAAVAGGVQAATDAVDAVGDAVDNMPKLSPEIRRERQRLLAAQLAEVEASRAAFWSDLEEVEARGRAALDVRSSLKRQPVQIAGLAAGTGFVLLGGPGRAWKYVRNRVIPRSVRPPLPPTLDGMLRSMGDDGTAAQELADMIAASGTRPRPGRIQRLLSGSVFLPIGLGMGRQLLGRLLDVDPAVRDRELAKIRARNTARAAEAAESEAAAEAAAEFGRSAPPAGATRPGPASSSATAAGGSGAQPPR